MPNVVDTIHRLIDEPVWRLGRHIEHDPRSRHFLAPQAVAPKTTMHTRHAPAWDQGNVGACTGFAEAGCLMTEPVWNPSWAFTARDALRLYSRATRLDAYPGSYPPLDTGSSGLAVMKAATREKLIAGYTHTFSFDGFLGALTLQPGIVGISWYASFDTPLPSGECPLLPNAGVRGGHEVEVWGLDVEQERIWCYQSWGATWGALKNGSFWFSWATMRRLLSEQGDATFPVAVKA
jgi:hypothetical protein